jgi:hypothetical protein
MARGSAGRDGGGIQAVKLLAGSHAGARNGDRELGILDHQRRGPVLEIEAGGGGVIPCANAGVGRSVDADKDQQIQAEVVVVIDFGVRVTTAATGRWRHTSIGTADAGLAERSVVPLLKVERVDAELGARNANPTVVVAGSRKVCVSHVEVIVAIGVQVDEGAGKGIAFVAVGDGWLGVGALKNGVARGATQNSIDRRGPGLATIRGTGESGGGVKGHIKHAARAMIFGLIDHDEVASGQRGILHDGAGRGVVAIKFGDVSRIALPQRHRASHHLGVVS